MLVPRGGEWGERVSREARHRSLEPLVVPLITDTDPEDPAAFATALAALADGAYAWIAVTSATAVRRVSERVPVLPAATRVAAVGSATAAACAAAGWSVDLVPEEASGAALAAAFPQTDGAVLFPSSQLSDLGLAAGLQRRGIDVHDVEAYRTEGTGRDRIALDPPPDALLVTSGSVAAQVAVRMKPLDPRTRVVCIGSGTARHADAFGLPVHAVAAAQTSASMLDTVVGLLHPRIDTQPGR